MNRLELDSGKPTTYRVARANGGSLHHALPTGSFTSLCGHTPKNTAREMADRGYWHIYRSTSGRLVTCRRCIEAERDEK